MNSPYLRITYGLQAFTALNLFLTIFMPWHSKTHSAASLIYSAVSRLSYPPNFGGLLVPWWFLILLFPFAIISILRGGLGLLEYQKMVAIKSMRIMGIACLVAISWFYFSTTELINLNSDTPGHIQYGFWLSAFSVALLNILILVEISLPDETIQERYGYSMECSYCGGTNVRGVRRCIHCGSYIFPDDMKKTRAS